VKVIRKSMNREEVASLVCVTLERHGIQAVLSGGSVVSIYSDNQYESYDLDFIEIGLGRPVGKAMSELGFEANGRHWVHPDTPYWVEFPAGPVQIGGMLVTEFAERTTRFGLLRLLHPTDCVMDRLAAYIHWNDTESLEQALLVARSQPIDIERIAVWADAEGGSEQFAEFSKRYSLRP
jgi:hypothetical protein